MKKSDSKKNDPNRKHKKNATKLLILFVNSILFFALYRLIVEMGERFRNPMIYYIGSTVYMVAVAVLIIAYFVLNGGTFGKYDPKWDDLPSGGRWTDERKADFLRRLPARQAKAKQLLHILLPLIVTLFLSYFELFLLS